MTITQNSFSKEELIACGHGHIFGPGNAQLPIDNMLMLDRITKITEQEGNFNKGYIEAELDIHPQLWFFDCPLPRRPSHAWLSWS